MRVEGGHVCREIANNSDAESQSILAEAAVVLFELKYL